MNRVVILWFLLLLTHSGLAQVNWDSVLNQMNDSINSWSLTQAQRIALEHLPLAKKETKAKRDSVIGQLYFGIALGYYQSDPASGIVYLDSAIDQTAEVNNIIENIRALNAKNSFLRQMGNLQEAKEISIETYHLVKEKAPDQQFLSARNVSVSYRLLSMYDSALHYILIADSVAAANKDDKQQYMAAQAASNIYLDMKNYEEAIRLIKEILSVGENRSEQMHERTNLGLAYLGLNKPDSALEAFEVSLNLAEVNNDSTAQANILGHIGKAFLQMDQPKKAIDNLNRSLVISNATSPGDIMAMSNILLSKALMEEQRPGEALRAAEKALSLALTIEHQEYQLEALDMLAISSAGLGLHLDAYNYSQQYLELNSLINERERMATIEELKAVYETERKEREIESLAQENQIKDLQLNQQRIVFIALTAVFLLTIILAILTYKQYQSRARQRQLSLEQNILRTQMNPHFIFNALASIQGFITRNKRKEAATYLAKFGELTRDILEASQKELIPISKEIEMIRNYVNLEQARFSKALNLDIELSGLTETDELLVPPMMIQPFLENAIKHGFKKRESGDIKVKISKNEELLHLSVTDNGTGMEESTAKERRSMAIQITRSRLQQLKKFGKNLPLNIDNIKDNKGNTSGVRVTFNLPIIYAH